LISPFPSPDLIESLKKGKAIAIVGSGLSSQVGGPTWEELLYGMVAKHVKLGQKRPIKLRPHFWKSTRTDFWSCTHLTEQFIYYLIKSLSWGSDGD
jgi:hypothetical protein